MAANVAGGGRGGFPWRIVGWGAAATLLLVPLVAMRFSDEVRWTALDFAFAAALICGVGLGLELAFRKSVSSAYRAAAGLALAASFLLVWINGAVGIIGSEAEPANLLFGGVLAVALLGSIVGRFRPAGMALAMAAAAVVQLAVPFIASQTTAAAWSPEVLGLTAAFATMWLLSAWLFRRAAA